MDDDRRVLGWREWIEAPDLGMPWLKVKADTGARTSSLHGTGIVRTNRDHEPWVRFTTSPWQGSDADAVEVEFPLVSEEQVRSSNGATELRPVVEIPVRLGGRAQMITVTLTDRSSMGFRMLLGRTSLAGHFLVDPAASYLLGRPDRSIRRLNRKKVD